MLEGFNELNPKNIKNITTQFGPGKVGVLDNGTKIIARPSSKQGSPTLEITVSKRKIYKIRY